MTNYRIEMRVVGAYRWDVVNTTEKVPRNTYTVSNLLEETDYEFRVSAENQAGQGPPSTASRSAKFGKFGLSFNRALRGHLNKLSAFFGRCDMAKWIWRFRFVNLDDIKHPRSLAYVRTRTHARTHARTHTHTHTHSLMLFLPKIR